ncbi:hypothetical protein CGJ25_24485 [Vibrio parahaemolyticus]|nr:hypothetical protein ACS91_27550 [Vibrio parahaemolyticus]TOA75220.1 hypothetical protein CGK19_24405 [Vibrio parahaemolyticus]TOA85432.1 hypothetical protein CGK17_23785 [Vibrio parahaemolyticus]TOF27396.1 hypothetical protein CGJ25_24485 [Vibrio parahaemolyticus]TOF96721.1 hypothetical protein CGJ10_23575 [Vibrio parahaemolyticus]
MYFKPVNKRSVILDMPMNRMELLIEIVKIENKAQQGIDNKELLSELGMLCFDAEMKDIILSERIKNVLKEVENILPGTLSTFGLDTI